MDQEIPRDFLSYFSCIQHDFNIFDIADSFLIKSFFDSLISNLNERQRSQAIYFLNEYLLQIVFRPIENYRIAHQNKKDNNIKLTRELHKHMNNNKKFRNSLESLTNTYNNIINYISIKENEITDEDLSKI